MNNCTYRICPNRSRAQIQAGARIEAGSERSNFINRGQARIQAGSRVNSSSLMAGVQIALLHVVFSNDALILNCAVRTSDLLRPCCSHFILQIMLCVA